MSKLDDFQIGDIIGLGGSAIVLSAYVKSIRDAFGIQLKVVLKLLTGEESGAEEVHSLAQMSSISQYCNLYDAFVVSRDELYDFAGKKLDAISDLIGVHLFPENQGKVTVIVLNLVSGERLVERRALEDDDSSASGRLVATDKGVFVDRLASKCANLNPKERIYLLMEMTKALAKRHALGVPHGDLNPGNVLWDPELNSITLIDLGLNRNFGVPGWRSPEQDQAKAERDPQFSNAADIFVMGQWISMLAGSQRSTTTLIKRCLDKDPKRRPTAVALYNKLRKQYYATFYKQLFLAAVVAVVLLGIIMWQQLASPSLQDMFPNDGKEYLQTVENMDLENMPNPKTLRTKIQGYLTHPDMTPELRDNLARALANYFRRLDPPPKHPFSGNANDIRAVWLGTGPIRGQTWIYFTNHNRWLSLGEWVSGEQFLLKVEVRYPEIDVVLEDRQGKQRVITIQEFRYPWEKSDKNMLLMMDCSVEKVLENISLNTEYHAAFPKHSFTRMRGVLVFDSTRDLIEQMMYVTKGRLRLEDKRLSLEPSPGDYLPWKYGTIYLKETTGKQLLGFLLSGSRLTLASGEDLIREDSLAIHANGLFWTDLLENYCLKDGVSYTIKGDELFLQRKPGQGNVE